MPGFRTWTPRVMRCCPSLLMPMASAMPHCGCSVGASSSWPAPSSSATAAVRNGGCRTICSSAPRRECHPGGHEHRVVPVCVVSLRAERGGAATVDRYCRRRCRGAVAPVRGAIAATGDAADRRGGPCRRRIRNAADGQRLGALPDAAGRQPDAGVDGCAVGSLRHHAQCVAACAAAALSGDCGHCGRGCPAGLPGRCRTGCPAVGPDGTGAAAGGLRVGAAAAAADAYRATLRRVCRAMSLLTGWLHALPWVLATALLVWALCTLRRNLGLVDIFWSLFVLVAALCFVREAPEPTSRMLLVLLLAGIWAVRLAAYLAVRNRNAPEDHRYQAIRARNQPRFAWKSLYLVFGLQAVLAFIVSLPLYAAMTSTAPLSVLDVAGAALVVAGVMVESIADAQLADFRDDPANRDAVLDQGLWRYSRHPNYFGEFCVCWGFFLLALAAGGWWSIASPLLMSLLLMRVSGVTLMEKDIKGRRPGYAGYVARTNAFFPGPRRST